VLPKAHLSFGMKLVVFVVFLEPVSELGNSLLSGKYQGKIEESGAVDVLACRKS